MTATLHDDVRLAVPAAASGPRLVRIDLASLFNAHAGFVARTLRRLGVPDSDVDDALQEVFLVAQSKLAVIEPGKERSFLFGVARRRASTVRRSLSRAFRRGAAETDAYDTEPAPDSTERVEHQHARAMLDEVLDALPFALRTVLVLHELEELEVAEIAEMLSVPVGTAASRLRRAREKFEIEAEHVRARLAIEGEQER